MEVCKKRILMIVNPFPPLGTVGGSIRTVKYLQYANPDLWQFYILTQDPHQMFLPSPQQASSMTESISSNITIYRKGDFLRLPTFLIRWREKKGNPSPDQSNHASPSYRQILVKILTQIKYLIFFPEGDIVWILSSLFFAKKLVYNKNIDLIYISVPPFSSIFLGFFLHQFTKRKIVLDMKDDWLEGSFRKKKNRLIIHLEQIVESRILKRASRILVPTLQGIESIRKRHPDISEEKFVYLPNGFDSAELKGPPLDEMPDNKRKFFIITCASGGLLRKYRNIEPFLRALSYACETNEDFKLNYRVRFLGSNVFEDYHTLIQNTNLDRAIEVYPAISRRQYVRFLKESDLFLLYQLTDTPSSISGTLYEYWAIDGVPICLIGGDGATRSFLIEKKLGNAFDETEIQKIAEYLIDSYQAWKKGTPVRIVVSPDRANYDRKCLAQKFEKILQAVLFNESVNN